MADVLLTSTEEIIQLVSVSGASQADITSAVNTHSALTTGVHGVGASTVASAVDVVNGVNSGAISIGGTYRLFGCVIRSNAGTWEIIDDAQHTPLNVSSIAQSSTKITLTFPFSGSELISCIVCNDEQYAGLFDFGVSLGLSTADIYCYRFARANHKNWLVSYTGAGPNYFSISAQAGGALAVVSGVWSSGEFIITHNASESLQGLVLIDAMGFEPIPFTSRNTYDLTHTYLKFWNRNGTQLTDPATFTAGYRFMIEKIDSTLGYAPLNPNSAELQVSNSNLWILGVIKV